MESTSSEFKFQLEKIQDINLQSHLRIKKYQKLFLTLVEFLTDQTSIHFSTLFSRISYLSQQLSLSKELNHLNQILRLDIENKLEINIDEDLYIHCIQQLIDLSQSENADDSKKHQIFYNKYQRKEQDFNKYLPLVKALIINVDTTLSRIEFIEDKYPRKIKVAQFGLESNELFNKTIHQLSKYHKLPLPANLIDCSIDDNLIFYPKAIVIDPDFLVDVTAIAQIFANPEVNPLLHLLSKFRPRTNSIALTVGNIANHMLDELIADPTLTFSSFLNTLFQKEALTLSLFDDKQVIQVVRKLKDHFSNLKNVVEVIFPKAGIDNKKVFLEPSFYSRNFGIQGRLDLLQIEPTAQSCTIVELKSGKPYKANSYGISRSHYIQTILYEMLVTSTSVEQIKTNNFILYSSQKEEALRHAPTIKAEQYKAIKIRNDIITFENILASPEHHHLVLQWLKGEKFSNLNGFVKKDLEEFESLSRRSSPVHLDYFIEYSKFIATEYRLSKTGKHGIWDKAGHAGLWLLNDIEKEEKYIILRSLLIKENKSNETEPILILERTTHTNTLANFRKGDIIIIYPSDSGKNRDNNQIFKGSIYEITNRDIIIKLRSRQVNQSIFIKNKYWNIEEDTLDSSFNNMYRSLYSFLKQNDRKKKLILGQIFPEQPIQSARIHYDELTEEQNHVINRALSANDYFLLWGPPGTGKTSKMIKNLSHHFHQGRKNILLLAYTNRAVDEICHAVLTIENTQEKIIRIGSKSSTPDEFHSLLLDQKVARISSRKDLVSLIDSHNIIIGTLSSLIGKHELFKLKKFEVAIVDEASQILEPLLANLLCEVEKFILIGDHKQLPAIVTQANSETKIKKNELIKIGITNTRNSLFERLYIQLLENNTTENLGILSQQGRMHQDIMSFVNIHFYNHKLKTISSISRLHEATSQYLSASDLPKRISFVNTETSKDLNWKTNKDEARKIAQLVKKYLNSSIKIDHSSIGIITLYRAQIACIKEELLKLQDNKTEKISVDTVERYQGGARDVIIISLCTNHFNQINSIVSLSEDGTDRKLNVALTRAKEQLVIYGNAEILSQNSVYKDLIDKFSI